MNGFHDVALFLPATFGLSGGPERAVEIVSLASGAERRNARWAGSRRRWEIGGGLVRNEEAHRLLAFFEARGGRLNGFRFRDPLDDRSCAPGRSPSATDQWLGVGDGARTRFALVKRYASAGAEAVRAIRRPVSGSLMVAVNGIGASATFDVGTSEIVLAAPPGTSAAVSAGYRFDAEARFDVDALELSIEGFDAVRVGRLSLVELVR